MVKVKIYSTRTCPYCNQAKAFFKEKDIEYTDVDVADNEKAAKEMLDKSGQMGTPVIDIDGKIIVGFDQEKIEEAIK